MSVVGREEFPYDLESVPTPAYVCDLGALDRNLAVLARAQAEAGCKILLALKGFAMWSAFDRVSASLAGVTSSSIYEARLGREEFGGEVHACAPAYNEADFRELLGLCDHVVVNSATQFARFRPVRDQFAEATGKRVQLGIRVNPEHREVDVPLYDPCAPFSRLGATQAALADADLSGLDGVHFHTLCELGSDALERTVDVVCRRFDALLSQSTFVNMGGGHHITRPGYDVERLARIVERLKQRYGVDVYLEPGEAVALRTGVLVTTVLDIVHNGMNIAILDTSGTAHMPDVLEMPYRPIIFGADEAGRKAHTYRLGGLTCLSGDVIGDFSFDRPLRVGDRLLFDDMIHYTMVKTTTFNGLRLPAIAHADPKTRTVKVVREFGYEDYKSRLS